MGGCESASGREEGFRRGVQGCEARAAAWRLGFGCGEEADNFAELSARGADDGCGLIESFGRLAGGNGKGCLAGAAYCAQGLTCAGERVTLAVHKALDLESHLDIAPAIEALTGSTFAGLELRKLRFPEPKDVGFNFADACYVANFEIETVGDCGLFLHALGG